MKVKKDQAVGEESSDYPQIRETDVTEKYDFKIP